MGRRGAMDLDLLFVEPVRTVMADPPWPGPVGDWRSRPLTAREYGRRAPSNVYDLMSLEAIRSLRAPVTPKAHLWLWALPQHVDWAWETARAWGFEPVHLLSWCKPGFGTGGFQANTEYIVLARKGGPKDNAFGRMSGTHYEWPRPLKADHSSKPDEAFELVEKVSPGPYLEMFSRRARPGWATWGKEAVAA
jgi:N6-adenosine-specific RNA methylase IME4